MTKIHMVFNGTEWEARSEFLVAGNPFGWIFGYGPTQAAAIGDMILKHRDFEVVGRQLTDGQSTFTEDILTQDDLDEAYDEGYEDARCEFDNDEYDCGYADGYDAAKLEMDNPVRAAS